MKEIKFRVWDVKKNRMYTGMNIRKFNSIAPFCNAPELFILMQYTGLHDKKGVEEYKGDKIKHWVGYLHNTRETISEIIWIDDLACWGEKDERGYTSPGVPVGEVIGNTYQEEATP